jgi:hypothetical protein
VHVLAPLRTLLARRPWLYWIVVALLAGLVANIAAGKLDAVDDARRSWGESADVWVAAAGAAPGDALVAQIRSLPHAMVPAGAVAADPTGRLAVQRLTPDEVVTTADVGDGPLALLPHGWQGVAFSADETTIRVRAGDTVAVVADGVVVVTRGVVLATSDRSVTVGVPAADAPAAALASRTQSAALTLRRP